MSFPSYCSFVPISYDENPLIVDDNQAVGYKWYQSNPSSEVDVMAASPCFYPVSLPPIYCQVGYKPPEPPPTDFSISYASGLSAYNLFDTSSERDLVAKDVVVQKDLMKDEVAVATQLFDKILVRNFNSMDAKVSHDTSSGENVSADVLETTITGIDTFIQTTDRILLQMEEIKHLILQLSPPSNRGEVLPKVEVNVLIGSCSELHDVTTDRKNWVGDVSVLDETVGFNRREKVACNEGVFKETELNVPETESNESEENGDTTEEYEPWNREWDWDDESDVEIETAVEDDSESVLGRTVVFRNSGDVCDGGEENWGTSEGCELWDRSWDWDREREEDGEVKEKRKSMLKGGDGESEFITENIFEIRSSLKLVDKNGDTKWHDKGEGNRVMELGMGVNEEFNGWTSVGMTYGVAAWKVMLGTVTTVSLQKLQQCILSWVFLKVVGVLKDKHLASRKEHGYGVNHWLRSFDNFDEVSMFVRLEMTYSCLAKYFKVLPINRKPKWYLKLLEEAKFLKKTVVGNPINFYLVCLPWKHIVSEHFDWKRFSEALNMILTLHPSYMNSSEASFTSTLSARVYFSSLGACKHCVVIKELNVYTTLALFSGKNLSHNGGTEVQKFKDMLRRCKAHCKVTSTVDYVCTVNVPAAYQYLIAMDPLNFSQDRVQINFNPEPHICEIPSKFAHKLDLLLGVTLDFGNLVIHEHQLERAFKRLFSMIDDCSVNQLPGSTTGKGNLFSVMGYKGTMVSISTRGDIALNFFASIIPQSFSISGDSFELHMKIAFLYVHDYKLRANLYYGFDISPFENVNDLTRHNEINERYDSNDENKSKEESGGANQRRRMVSAGSKKYPLKPYQMLKKDYYFIDQFVCKRLTSEKPKVHVMVLAQICKEVVQYIFMEIKRLMQGVLKVFAELDKSKELEVSILKMTTLSWYLNIIIVVFDPGGESGYLQYSSNGIHP